MRIWDLHPGYLSRQRLLGEHRELHGIVSIIKNNKKGYSKHPETLRWVSYGWALKQRHALLSSEMRLRGYADKSPVLLRRNPGAWPSAFIDTPADQIAILKDKYHTREAGRIPLPENAQDMWAQHKYSVMARNVGEYKVMGRYFATRRGARDLEHGALELVSMLRCPPEPRLLENTLLHMWGYVSDRAVNAGEVVGTLSHRALLQRIQVLARKHHVTYLLESTALSELAAWPL